MFKVIQKGTNRLDLEMSGKLDAKEVKIATPHGNSEISSQ